MGADDFRAQEAQVAKLRQQVGESIMRNAVLTWANANRDALVAAGLLESLLRVCGQ